MTQNLNKSFPCTSHWLKLSHISHLPATGVGKSTLSSEYSHAQLKTWIFVVRKKVENDWESGPAIMALYDERSLYGQTNLELNFDK